MAIELKIPTVGESITEVMIGEWLKAEGDWVAEDEPLVIIETDKVNVELPAPEGGILEKILKQEGDDAEVGDVVGLLKPAEKPAGEPAKAEPAAAPAAEAAPATEPAAAGAEPRVMPAAARVLAEKGLEASDVQATGPGGRLLKEDVERHAAKAPAPPAAPPAAPAAVPEPAPAVGSRHEETVRMTPLRRRVAARLVEAQQSAALLTTFNEIDMSAVIALRKQYQERFVKKYGLKVGFMSFFVKAVVEALKEVPQVNAEIRGDELIYRNYQDIGIAVGGGKGLVVPIIRNAERLSFAGVEQTIADYAGRARDGKLKLEELQGGTFTISNGGIYGSLLSTPIVNPPQSGILGMHKIEQRPIAVDGEVVVRPMMYVALTYDHRLIDGREAVTFLVRVKERIEDPTRILLEV
ncbi:MAG: 2-oxoglutarate dehydrogenase complex dihydrolipoyllysine-residue succinyltransferase [bacterium]|nr:2-oxoglutarate dehydrogenase complex dihydrolipoyllysine-residue succinyltransferase [bacterium]